VDEGTWQRFAAGNRRSAGVNLSGEVLSWGVSPVGDDTLDTAVFPRSVSAPLNPVALSAGSHIALITPDGALWGWGDNFEGQVGTGTNQDFVLRPTRIGQRNDWGQVDLSSSHSLAVDNAGKLWAWGLNSSGELGLGSTSSEFAPVEVTGLAPGILAASAGEGFTAVLRADGTLWTWGANAGGQLGNGTILPRLAPAQVGTDTDWRLVAAGGSHLLVVKADGSLWVCGGNRNNELGDGTRTSKSVLTLHPLIKDIRAVAAGFQFSAVIKTDGSLWAWGRNDNGQLGDGTTTARAQPVRVGSSTNWVALSTGVHHTLAAQSDGSLWAWGENDFGELGTSRLYSVGASTDWGPKP
jgi:alpha-tubulin suppressor-like RCC1 family protein